MYTKGTWDSVEALLYGSEHYQTTFLWECSMNSILMEVNIACRSEHCAVERLRRLKPPNQHRNGIAIPYGFVHYWQVNRYLIQHLAALGGETSSFRPNPVNAYIYGTANPWAVVDGTDKAPLQD